MTRFLSAISILLIAGVFVARGQQNTSDLISEADKAGIIESILHLEQGNQASLVGSPYVRQVSSENIEFIDPSRLSKHGFTLVPSSELRRAKAENVVDYLVFKEFLLRDGVANVVLTRVTEGRPCFSAPFSNESNTTYESRSTPVGWIAQLIKKPTPFRPRRNVWP
jgi:hypothetical protein